MEKKNCSCCDAKKYIADLEDGYCLYCHEIISPLKAKLAKAGEGLKFYADRNKYRRSNGMRIDQCDIFIDDGDVARESLEAIKGDKNGTT